MVMGSLGDMPELMCGHDCVLSIGVSSEDEENSGLI